LRATTDEVVICWTHAGGGPLANQFAALAKEKLDGRGNITYRFLGAVSNDKVIRFYQENAVDLFITASQTEGGVPVSIMEAFSFGVPAIATRVGGIPEIADDKTGFLLPENPTEEEIADALCAFVQMSPDARSIMKQNARQKWNDNFCAQTNHEKFARMLLQLFNQDMR
jgi:glycosyltransferase involved in cell wall biosynthesis